MKIRKAVVTGAAGFIGSYLSRRLLGEGVSVLAVDNFSNLPERRVPFLFPNGELTIQRLDVLDRNAFGNALKTFGPFDAFFDLAYINGTKQFYDRAWEILQHAGRHVQESLFWVRQNNARWVYFSTPEIYGEPGVLPTPEDHRVLLCDLRNPRLSYAIGKIYSESYIHAARLADRSLDAVMVRPNNAYGPTDRYHVIADLMAKIFTGEHLSIQGTGDETRSFCYVDDVVTQILLVFENGLAGEAYGLGSSEEVTIKELVDALKSVTGHAGQISFSPLSRGSPTRRCPDLSKIKSLGAPPARTLREGLAQTWRIEKDYRNVR